MKVRCLVSVFLTASLFLSCAASAHAQQGGRKYFRPPSPTISPWMDLFRKDPGPLDNYHSFVRPKQRVYDALGRQNFEIQQQQAQTRDLGQELSRFERASLARPTGTGSTFMNYSHYYPLQRSAGGRRGR
ncbi:MAG: hypothetical protein JW888_07950 [Pirellulales bacterium]|nr:hypothetical protein [Pirellulales bacterium]